MTSEQDKSTRRYASASMRERRARIAAAARALIVERGVENFAMSDVAARAGVSDKTLYNAVGNKQRLVAQAVAEYQRQLADEARPHPGDTLEEIVASLEATGRQLMTERGWAEAIAHLYFAPDIDPETYASLQGVARTHVEPTLAIFAARDQLDERVDTKLLSQLFTNVAYSLVHDWALGRVADEAFPLHIAIALLGAVSFAARPEARRQIEPLMDRIGARLATIPPVQPVVSAEIAIGAESTG